LEQLEDTRQQLTDSEKTLTDSEEQLADSKTAALEGTNMNNLLTVSTVSGILTAQNFSMPAGYARDEKTDCLIYVGDKLTDAQEEEIEECGWYNFDDALKVLNYDNDRFILTEAMNFIRENNI